MYPAIIWTVRLFDAVSKLPIGLIAFSPLDSLQGFFLFLAWRNYIGLRLLSTNLYFPSVPTILIGWIQSYLEPPCLQQLNRGPYIADH